VKKKMTEKKNIREMINEAIGLYDKGEWNAAIASLYLLQGNPEISVKEGREIKMYLGWNYWKKQDKDVAKSYWSDAISDYYGILDMDNAEKAASITKASAHAGLGIYYAPKKAKKKKLCIMPNLRRNYFQKMPQ
jgi:outer membrane protein assembly factor BamD (BamD/ComL family)